jgi:hypothetical protein
MQDTALNHFIEEIMHITAGFAGMGGASAAIIGASSTNEPLINQLRSHALAFAAEYVKTQADRAALDMVSGQLEGELRSVQLIGGISEAELAGLLSKLYALLDEMPRR